MRVIPATAVVALLLMAGAGSAQAEGVVPPDSSWKGETSVGLPVYFAVSGGHVVNVRFKFKWGFCGTFELHDGYADAPIDSNGHWSFEDPRGQTIEGTFVAPDQGEGTLVSVERELPGCPRTEATFTAAPVHPNPENFAAARAGIESLPYEIDLKQARGTQNALIGTVHGNLGESFRFFLFVNRKPAKRLRKVPDYGTHGPDNELPDRGLAGGQLANTDYLFSTVPRRGETDPQVKDHYAILFAVEDTICLRQTGERCSPHLSR
ncbi:MAG TPA: hypothetical protein VFJ65_12690 [Solirubrobacterales bacterium]|nr:hypothetical protein [Solirubrobacterales bacterium]